MCRWMGGVRWQIINVAFPPPCIPGEPAAVPTPSVGRLRTRLAHSDSRQRTYLTWDAEALGPSRSSQQLKPGIPLLLANWHSFLPSP